ncbi:MAG: AraC family transcriptional regulator [Bacteroidales bacterium]|nr:AraC family transcriptional regulator [Bacteroidales bacterium]
MGNNIFYIQEHLSCSHYVSDYRCSFTYRNIGRGDTMDLDRKYNYLIFVLNGEVVVSCNEFIDRHFAKGDMFLIPKSAATKFTAGADSELMGCTFDTVKNICDKLCLASFWPICKDMEYDFRPIKMVPQFEIFLEQLLCRLHDGVKCEHFHELKHQEMFLLFRWFYTKEQLAELFHPIIGKSLGFKTFVLENYLKVKNIYELAKLSAMSRSRFDITFKKEFDISAGQWLLKQKAKHIKFEMAAPEVNISDIIIKFDFNSAVHFNRFCKQQFGCTPQEMILKLRNREEACVSPT